MTTLEMTCPGCGQVLELDAGFAGGVCRCSHCGTLMTVPTHAGTAPERLQRPEAPRQRPDAPAVPDHDAATPPANTADLTPQTHDQAMPEGPADPEAEPQTLTTDSGRTVEITSDAVIPTAKRKARPIVRIVAALVLLLVFVPLVGVSGYAIFLAAGSGEKSAPQDSAKAAVDQFGFDPTVNVYTLKQANVLGLPLESSAVVVVDASAASRRWLGLVQDAVRVGVTGKSKQGQFGLIYATESEVRTLSDQMLPLPEVTSKQVHEFQMEVHPLGVASLSPAVAQAATWQPEQIILITGQELDDNAVQSIAEALTSQPNLKFDVVTVNTDIPALKELAKNHSGRYVQLSQGQLLRWYKAADIPLP